MYHVSTLLTGLRVATTSLPHMDSVSIGVWVGVGGRYEPRRLTGISHFTEHLLFKGTHRRSARQISQEVEGLGGYLNAFTGEETTCYYARASHRHFPTLLDVLSDMYQHPRLAPGDIAKERGVIKEELLMYRDQPDHYVHELLLKTLWPEHPLGRSLIGTPETLDAMNRAALLHYRRRYYLPDNTIVVAAGHCEHQDIVDQVRRSLPLRGQGRARRFIAARSDQRTVRLKFLTRPVEQTHLALGIRGYSRHHRHRYAVKLLSVILGENMSSRLFQTVREQHALTYSIQSACNFFADTGVMVISASLDPRHLGKALRLVLRELTRISRQPPTDAELQRAKDYAIGQMRLGLESTSNQMMWAGDQLLAYGRIRSPEEIERHIEAVTRRQVQQVAAALFHDHRLNAAVITPGKNEPQVADLLTFAR